MVFVEEGKSNLEEAIGRRFPLAVLLLIVLSVAAYLHYEAMVTGLLVIVGIVFRAYYDAVSEEKQTIRMIANETTEAVKNV